MTTIPFTQYKRPYGQKVETGIERPEPVAEAAQRIMKAGYKFECEVISKEEVSLTIVTDEESVACEVVPNGPEVPQAVDRMILQFAEVLEGRQA